jgi:hypothetical protein
MGAAPPPIGTSVAHIPFTDGITAGKEAETTG